MKTFLLRTSNQSKSGFIWNMTGSLFTAFQSVIFLAILTRSVGLIESGIFTLAYANANLYLNIGKFGMRNFQVSDVKREFTFPEYRHSRMLTSIAMLIVSVIHVIFSNIRYNYTWEKSQIILWMCLFKIPDALEDVYHGDYQKKGRLDVAAKAMTIRMVTTVVLFAIIIIVTNNLLAALMISTCVTFLLLYLMIKWTRPLFQDDEIRRIENVYLLLRKCLPVFLSTFLTFYIGNAPKYAIDVQLSDQMQACYGFIAMPVFVIGLLNSFVLNPILYRISCLWSENRRFLFFRQIMWQIVIVIGITVCCLGGAYILGVPVLSLLYNTDLSAYKKELLILLLGGGFLGLSGVLSTAITIMRRQRTLVVVYGIVAIVAFIVSDDVVGTYQMWGAAMLYTGLMALVTLGFFGIFCWGIRRKKGDMVSEGEGNKHE